MRKTIATLIAILIYICGIAQDSSFVSQDTCIASFYHGWFHGKQTASGIKFDNSRMYAAHKTMPFGTILRITNTANGKSILVKIVDRGPYIEGRDIDLSYAAAESLGYIGKGLANVVYEIMPKKSVAAAAWRKEDKRREIRASAEAARAEAEAFAKAQMETGDETFIRKLVDRFTSPVVMERFASAGKTMYHMLVSRLKTEHETTATAKMQ